MSPEREPGGWTLGPYQITARLGAGAMGEVYRGRDARLDRDVAIKLLPLDLSSDPRRLARLEREARVLASLNHPRIAAIYGIEEYQTADAQQVALILELVEGDTLDEHLARRRVPLAETVAIAGQIADALEAAHDKGIVHRDLKPANIKLTRDGTVKVLDFGLATTAGDEQPPADGATIAIDRTEAGLVLGTPAYMSPEQARGHAVDKRTDIWAFGCVLYALLTGRQPFSAPTVTDTIAAVIDREPDWTALPPETPSSIRRLLRRALEKDLHRRLRDIGDARADLDAGEATDTTPAARPDARTGRERTVWSALMLVAASGAFVAAQLFRDRPVAPPIHFEVTRPATAYAQLAFSPDGTQLAVAPTFDAKGALWLRRVDAVQPTKLRGTEGATFPFWSPDGKAIGFFADRKLKRIDLDGEAVSTLADAPVARGGAWRSDGTIVFAPSVSAALSRVSSTGGDAQPFTQLAKGQTDHRVPQILPGGAHVLYFARGTPDAKGVYVAKIDGSDSRRLLSADAAAVYATSGHLLFIRENALFAQRFNLDHLALEGSAVQVADSVVVNAGISIATLAASPTSAIAYGTGGGGRSQLVWFDRAGNRLEAVGAAESVPSGNPSLSPDGTRIALNRNVGGNWDIWILESARGTLTRLTSAPGLEFFPIWTPDGSRVVYQSSRPDTPDLYAKPADGTGEEELLLKTPRPKNPTDISRDGHFLLFNVADAATDSDIWVLPLQGNGQPRALVQSTFVERDAQFSPDGRWIAFMANDTGRFEAYIQSFPGPGRRIRVSVDGGSHVRWARSGAELFFIAPDKRLMVAAIALGEKGPARAGQPSALFATTLNPASFGNNQGYMVSDDDRRFLMTVIEPAAPSSIVVMLNWKGPF